MKIVHAARKQVKWEGERENRDRETTVAETKQSRTIRDEGHVGVHQRGRREQGGETGGARGKGSKGYTSRRVM